MQTFPNPRTIATGKDARERLLDGVNSLAEIVGSTMGPGGNNAILGVRGDRVR